MSVSRYLVTGAYGFVGRRLGRRLVDMNIPVRGTFRSVQFVPGTDIEPSLIGAIDGQTNWTNALQGVVVVRYSCICMRVNEAVTDFKVWRQAKYFSARMNRILDTGT